MPRASKALDAAKQLGRTVAASAQRGSGAKATKSAKATKVAKAPAKRVAKAPAKRVAKAEPAKKAAAKKAPASRKSPAATSAKRPAKAPAATRPAKRLEGAGTEKFLQEQRALLVEERVTYLAQATSLKAEADQLAQEMEPGDIQFDDESGEGATAAVDRERDLALSAQARVEVDEIDHALAKLDNGTYGICERCGEPIPRARLKALPHARLCVTCKSGGLSRR